MAPADFIAHLLDEVNDGFAHRRYVSIVVAWGGIALYQTDSEGLHQPRPMTPAQGLSLAQGYFAQWMPGAPRKQDLATAGLNNGYLNDTAFLFHQAAGHLYHGAVLTVTFCATHVHNLS